MHPTDSRAKGVLVALTLLSIGLDTYAAPLGSFDTMVSITFDDANEDGYTAGAPLLAQYGYRGTYYLLTGSMNNPGRLSTAEAQELVRQGHEMGSHTVTHADLTTLVEAQIVQELLASKDWIVANVGVPDVTSFAAPSGRTNPSCSERHRFPWACSASSRNLSSRWRLLTVFAKRLSTGAGRTLGITSPSLPGLTATIRSSGCRRTSRRRCMGSESRGSRSPAAAA